MLIFIWPSPFIEALQYLYLCGGGGGVLFEKTDNYDAIVH